MASQSSIQFIDAALFFPTTFPLSYTDPNQKWLIRSHLLSLLQNFPSFRPSMSSFTHNSGATANLLTVSGDLHVAGDLPPVPISIWVHENYPHMAPIVLVSSNSAYPIRPDNPFVDRSGETTSAYLQTWVHPKSNLFDLVQNLIKIFSHNHPLFHTSSSNLSTLSHPSLVSKREAIDRLSCTLHSDLTSFKAQSEKEIEKLSVLQGEMNKRVFITTRMVVRLEQERFELERRVKEVAEQGDVLINWLRVYGRRGDEEAEEVFECVDEASKAVLDCSAKDMALEDLMYALDKGIEHGVVPFGTYIRQVRVLAREQFCHRAMVHKLMGS